MARRGRGEGSIFQLADGTWMGTISLGVVAGKRVRKSVTAPDKQTVLKRLRELRAKVEAGAKDPDQTPIAEFLVRWLEEFVKVQRRPNTFRQYESLVRVHIIPAIGNIQLGRLTAQHVHGLMASMEKAGHGAVLRAMTRRTLATALEQAIKWELIDRNVARKVDPPQIPRREFVTWSDEQCQAFWKTAESDRVMFAALYLAVSCGMRSGEVRALQWSSVDLAAGTVSVKHTLFKPKGEEPILGDVKTSAGVRVIHMGQSVVEALKRHRGWLLERGMSGKPMVFPSDTGKYISCRVFERRFYRLCEAAGLPKIRIHDLRHTSATLLLQAGVHPKIVSERLGHSNIAITLDLYSHVTPRMDQGAAAKIDELIRGG